MCYTGVKALDKRTPVKSADFETRRNTLNSTFKTLIAFALVERNENNEASSASSRSTRSVDMGQDSLDILRVHGIVQAFFVDLLAEERCAAFWLERATSMYCRAFDISDSRVKEDPQTGVPEDFRRFLIHGERLLFHISRFERRHPELTVCRELVEDRIGTIDKRIDQLTERITNISSQSSAPILSVFERTNSLSEGDSETPPSNSSITEPYSVYGESPIESPAIYGPDDYNPYHWHVSYPHGDVPYDDIDYSRTVTPQPLPTEVFESMSMPDDDEITRKVFGPHHRTIKRRAERRYRDHAGSWRVDRQILADPRVSISRETARGIIHPTATEDLRGPVTSSGSVISDATRAQVTLDRINRGSPSARRESIDSGVDYSSDTAPPAVRPRLVAGRPSYADAKAEATLNDDYPMSTTFSSPLPSSNSAAAEILRRRENEHSASFDGLTPIKVSSPLTAAPLTATTPPSPSPPTTQIPISSFAEPVSRPPSGSRSRSPSNPPSRQPSRPSSLVLSRSARSSPSHPTGPFPPPPPIPIEINTSSSLRSPPPPNPQVWGDSYRRLSQTSIAEEDEYKHLSHSLPSIQPRSLPYPHTVHIPPDNFPLDHPPPWVSSSPNLHPSGYSSQPMSRDPSHQSSHSFNSAASSSSAAPRNGSPLARPGYSSSPGSQIMQRPRSRRPSVVETEPSPRLAGLEGEPVVTSYSLYNSNHNHGRDRGRRRTATTATSPGVPRAANSNSIFTRFKPRRRGSGNGNEGGRRHRSASGRLSFGRGVRGAGSATTSPDLGAGAGAEAMARSASGGVRLADGTVVEFGAQGVAPPGAGAGAGAGDAATNSPPPLSRSPPSRMSRFSPHRLSRRSRDGSASARRNSEMEGAGVGLGIQQQQQQQQQGESP